MTAHGRSATDMLPRTAHSARRTRDRQNPANLDPELPVATVGLRATHSSVTGTREPMVSQTCQLLQTSEQRPSRQNT